MKKATRILAIALAFVLFANVPVHAGINFGKIMQKRIKQAVGATAFRNDFKGFHWLTLPTNNFGVFTAFGLRNRFDDPSFDNQICATFTCIGESTPVDFQEWLNVKSYADVGQSFASLNLSSDEKTKIAVELILPKIYQVLQIEPSTKIRNAVQTEMSLGTIWVRRLKAQRICDYLDLPQNANSILKKKFDERLLALAIADVIIESMTLKLTVNKGEDDGLTAKLDTGLNQILGPGAGVKLKIEKEAYGVYKVTTTEPLIVARRVVEQPSRPIACERDGGIVTVLSARWEAWKNKKLGGQ